MKRVDDVRFTLRLGTFFQPREHDNRRHVLLPQHAYKRSERTRRWALCSNPRVLPVEIGHVVRVDITRRRIIVLALRTRGGWKCETRTSGVNQTVAQCCESRPPRRRKNNFTSMSLVKGKGGDTSSLTLVLGFGRISPYRLSTLPRAYSGSCNLFNSGGGERMGRVSDTGVAERF